ncbi:MAG TPA: hypothetical protein VK157_06235 [Phycisphaerales bacterium]|nr:hypothetical protein [Phycisphaerales bacterium]
MRVSPLAVYLIAASTCSLASTAFAQLNEAVGAQLTAQVFNPATGTWGSSLSTFTGSRVEYRYVVSYTGTNTSVLALGGITYQPTMSNADNSGTGTAIDQMQPWRTGSTPILTRAEGANGGALSSYGRVQYGATAMTAALGNALTTFRHGGGAPVNGAPTGSWLRVSGSSVTTWPAATLPTGASATAAALNSINRGVISNQLSSRNPITGAFNTHWMGGVTNLVVFRGAVQLSDLPGSVSFSIADGSLMRLGGAGSADDRRYMSWQIGIYDNGSWRVGVTVAPATVTIVGGLVPSPSVPIIAGMALAYAARRRR